MKRLIYITLIYAIGCSSAYCQSSLSDSLFAIGFDLYNAGKYKEALPAFEQLLSIDSIIYRKTRPQKIVYSGMWLGHTLYKLGREKDAQNNEYTRLYYKAPPLTIDACLSQTLYQMKPDDMLKLVTMKKQ